jgi:hypothetical protein
MHLRKVLQARPRGSEVVVDCLRGNDESESREWGYVSGATRWAPRRRVKEGVRVRVRVRGVLYCAVLQSFAPDAAGKLHVPGHDGDPLGVDGAEVGVLEESDEVCLGGVL